MIKYISILVVSVITATSCNPDKEKKMNSTKETSSSRQADSISAYAKVNGLNMYYEIHGKGEPLVLIHGGGSTIQTTFGSILHSLAESHKVIAVEMQAHGRTADIDRPLSFKQDADDIAALLKHLSIEKAHVFGFSNGASTTLEFAIRHPEMADKIVVASTFYKKSGAPAWFWEMMSKPSFEAMPQPYKDIFLKLNNNDTAALYRMYERDVARMQSFPDISDEEISSIQAPTLIMLGDKDVTLPAHAAEMNRLIKNSRLVILPSGHGDYIGELIMPKDSVLINAAVHMIDKFLKE